MTPFDWRLFQQIYNDLFNANFTYYVTFPNVLLPLKDYLNQIEALQCLKIKITNFQILFGSTALNKETR